MIMHNHISFHHICYDPFRIYKTRALMVPLIRMVLPNLKLLQLYDGCVAKSIGSSYPLPIQTGVYNAMQGVCHRCRWSAPTPYWVCILWQAI